MQRSIFSAMFILASFFCVHTSWAIKEKDFAKNIQSQIVPFFSAIPSQAFLGKKNTNINYKIFQGDALSAKRCLLILPGRQEPIEKYSEVVYDLLHSEVGPQLSIFLMDHRGQGSSGRFTENTQIGYVDHFENYIDDVLLFVRDVVSSYDCSQGKFLLAHSMGGAIGLGVIRKQPKLFKAAIMTSPMWKINSKPYPYWFASFLASLGQFLGKDKKYAPKQKDLDLQQTFLENTATHSPQRFQMSMDVYRQNPATMVGGVSYGWLKRSMDYTHKLRLAASEIKLPMQLFIAGQDTYVVPSVQKRMCRKNPNCQFHYFPMARHELLMEQDIIRDKVMKSLIHMLATGSND